MADKKTPDTVTLTAPNGRTVITVDAERADHFRRLGYTTEHARPAAKKT